MSNKLPIRNSSSDQNKNCKFSQLKIKTRLFPFLKNIDLFKDLKIDYESLYSISLREIAETISLIILQHIGYKTAIKTNLIITDATAGVGGNTLSFSKYFAKVNSIEIDQKRFCYLQNNISIYNANNIDIYNCDYMDLHDILYQDIIFIDPPWGGRAYKSYPKLRLMLSNMTLEDLCMETLKYAKLVVVKIPKNYDLSYYQKIFDKTKFKLYIYELQKMIILTIEKI